MDVNQKYCQSCHLISRNGFIITKIMTFKVHSTHASIAIKICHFYVNPFNTCDAIAIDGDRCASQKFYDANRGNHKSVISALAHELNFARSVFCTFLEYHPPFPIRHSAHSHILDSYLLY
jgi:hypothetical protein